MNLFPNARWIFFDVGYTLLDETPAWEPLFAQLSAELARDGRPTGVDVIWQTFRQVATDYEPKQWWGLCKRLAADDVEAKKFEQVAGLWNHGLQVPHEGAGGVLKLLSQRYKLGIIANQAIGTADRMKQQGWDGYFSAIIGSAEAGVTKPDLQIFTLALEHAGCKPGEAVMIGDRIDNDIKPAKLLGMGTVHVRQGVSGAQQPRDESDQPTATVAGIADVPGVFGLPAL